MLIVFNLILIAMALLIAYWWANQGLFSAIIHLLCVIVAGAVSLSMWEPLTTGFMLRGGAFDGYAWGVSLIGVFVVTLLVLRIATNKLVPANVDLPHWANLAFGFPVGAASGVLTVGILVLGLGFIQSGSKMMGFAGWSRQSNGKVVEVDTLWVPFHQITDGFYSTLSVGSLKTSRPLRSYQPDLYRLSASLMRDSFREGRGHIAMRPSAASVRGAWLCPSRCLVRVVFERGALYGDQLVLSASQVRLIGSAHGFESPTTAHPVRWSQPTKDAPSATFRFDDPSHYATSVPGRENADILFEFPWMSAQPPRFIQVRGARLDISKVQELDDAVCEGMLAGVSAAGVVSAPTDVYGARPLSAGDIRVSIDIRPITTSTNMLPGTIKEVDKFLVEGYALFPNERQFLARNLMIQGLHEPPGTKIIQLDVGRDSTADMYGEARKSAGEGAAPMLVDIEGNTYTAYGYIHESVEGTAIRLNPVGGINSVSELPSLPSSGGEKIRLLFRVTEGATIVGVRLGEVPIASCNLVAVSTR